MFLREWTTFSVVSTWFFLGLALGLSLFYVAEVGSESYTPIRCRVSLFLVGETVVKIHGLRAYIWSAVDVDSGEILAICASWSRNILISMRFLRMVLSRCINKPLMVVDRGHWYRWALDRPGLKYRYQRFGLRNRLRGSSDT